MRITGKTKITFILGDPVDHIVGTDILNNAFAARGIDMACSPLRVPPDALGQVFATMRHLGNVAGFGCTIPHKAAALSLVDDVTAEAAEAGAVNYVRRNPDGSLTGHNIDGTGFLAGLASHDVTLSGKRVLQVGAGGVGKAIAFAVAKGGTAELLIANRSIERAEGLAASVRKATGCKTSAVASEAMPPAEDFGLVINCTSMGMRAGDSLPFDPSRLMPFTTVAEVIMTPAMTPILEAAAARGCRIVPGRAMMDPQAALVAEFLRL